MTGGDDGTERVVLVPDEELAAAVRGADGLAVEAVAGGSAAVRERVAAGGVDGVVYRDKGPADEGAHRDEGAEDDIVTAAREAAAGLPVVRVVPDDGPAAPADPDERTAHVRQVGDWPSAVADRVDRLVRETPYRELYHAADEGLLLHPGETADVVATNERLHAMLGYDPAADLGIDEIIAGEQAEFSRAEARAQVRDTIENGEQTFEWLDERKDGSTVWVEVTLRPVEVRGEQQVVATVRDIDERKAREEEVVTAEAAASDAEAQLDDTLARVSDAFFGLDDDWRFTYLNDQAAELLDVDPEAVRGESVWTEFSEAVGTQFEYEYRAAMHTQEPTAFESYYPPLDAWFEVSAYPSPDGLSVYFRDVTGRKEREEELEAYERLVENVEGELFVLDEAGRFELVTEPLADWLGRDRDAVEGEPAAPLLAPSDPANASTLRDAAAEGRPATFETEIVAPSGRRTGVVDLSPIPSGVVGTLRDVTDERARQRRHDALIDNVPGMVYRWSVGRPPTADGGARAAGPGASEAVEPRMTFASEAASDLVGAEPAALSAGEADWLADVVHPDDRGSLLESLRTAIEQREPFTVRYRVVTPSGTKWVRDRGRPVVGPDGNVTSVEGFVVEVTDETQRERHRRVMMRVLRHNLRNSVQVVHGFATEIAAAADDEELAELADPIVARARQLGELSEMAREASEAVAAATGDSGTVDAAALCREVAAEHEASHPGATVVADVPDAVRVGADASLERAIDALVENAVVHNDGDPTVRLSVVDPEREGWVGLRIADDGPGIPDRERQVLAHDTEITQLVHGQGMGLWLSKWLVESHGGELRIQEEDDSTDGATVLLLLPRAE